MSIYNNAKIILATKHKKEQVIKNVFFEQFSADIFVPQDYDTDQFGTFTGEVARKKSPLETVIEKAKNAAIHYGFDRAIANEGSFGPHPAFFFAPCDVELMSFIDLKNDLEIIESEITTDTNYNQIEISSTDNYENYLEKAKFPSHGLIIRSLDDNKIIKKGIIHLDDLKENINFLFKKYEKIRLETDMRAMMNPTRMSIIHNLAIKLANRLKQTCKKCHLPGFGKISLSGNLPCQACGSKTELYEKRILSCIKCDYHEVSSRTDMLTKSDPKYCPYCNP